MPNNPVHVDIMRRPIKDIDIHYCKSKNPDGEYEFDTTWLVMTVLVISFVRAIYTALRTYELIIIIIIIRY